MISAILGTLLRPRLVAAYSRAQRRHPAARRGVPGHDRRGRRCAREPARRAAGRGTGHAGRRRAGPRRQLSAADPGTSPRPRPSSAGRSTSTCSPRSPAPAGRGRRALRELTTPSSSAGHRPVTYDFRHALIRDALYATPTCPHGGGCTTGQHATAAGRGYRRLHLAHYEHAGCPGTRSRTRCRRAARRPRCPRTARRSSCTAGRCGTSPPARRQPGRTAGRARRRSRRHRRQRAAAAAYRGIRAASALATGGRRRAGAAHRRRPHLLGASLDTRIGPLRRRWTASTERPARPGSGPAALRHVRRVHAGPAARRGNRATASARRRPAVSDDQPRSTSRRHSAPCWSSPAGWTRAGG